MSADHTLSQMSMSATICFHVNKYVLTHWVAMSAVVIVDMHQMETCAMVGYKHAHKQLYTYFHAQLHCIRIAYMTLLTYNMFTNVASYF